MSLNLTDPIVLNPILNVTLNATLYQPTQELYYTWIKDWAPIIISLGQILLSLALVVLSYLLWRSTSQYATQVEQQTEIMRTNIRLQRDQVDINRQNIELQREQIGIDHEKMNHDITVMKYNRLRDEMDKLVAPLYFATLTVKEGDEGWFGYKDPAKRTSEIKHIFEFWDEMKMNAYLSRSKDLSEYLTNRFDLYNEVAVTKPRVEARTEFDKNNEALIKEIKDKRYPDLKREIDEVEVELGIRKEIK